MTGKESCRVALVQASSVVLDKGKTLERTVHYIKEAKENGADLVVFPEAFIPAYPRGMDFGAVVGSRSDVGRKDFARYAKESVVVPSEDTDRIAEAAKEAGVYVVIGVIEKDRELSGTLYCTVLFFSPEGILLGKHRKLKPTGSERLIWSEGDGSTLPVFDTPFGRIGALICWENYMPLARTAMYAQGIDIYIAPTADARDTWFSTMRHIALEGRCFVLSCNQYSTKSDYPADIQARQSFKQLPEELSRGGSCVVGPLGNWIVEPVLGEKKVIYADLALEKLLEARYDFDPVGHYSRPDVFELIVHRDKKEGFRWEE